ncbi:ABC transporter ATP-binding protein [Atopobacter sp. AH10]|uniref:ABC transporter ATP-binding protein n=1 Tax=Atopobacter sp. AH10 TaxID=2315861 RepID=UPI000EF1A7A8|nr:ABC transporter ATP-binding protein [Atopobacter sp. AH10]RLK63928.1 ABC transporter ATP-binding protein [Atopobacter sp. AH10]
MINYFMRRYAMSEKGAKNLKKAILSRTLLNLTKLCPPFIAFVFIGQYLESDYGLSLNLATYISCIAVMFVLMFLVARFNYRHLYINVYEESANSRIEMANRLKKLPLSYFDKHSASDLATSMMSDIGTYEEIFSHAVPHIYATALSTCLIFLMLFLYNWRLAVSAIWVIPVSLLFFNLSKFLRTKANDSFVKNNRQVIDVMQENIEQIQEIKAYSFEKERADQFSNVVNSNTKAKINAEMASGATLSIAVMLLRLGIVSVALVGANLLQEKQVDMFTYVIFLVMTASIYLPVQNILSFMGMIDMLDSVVKRIKEIKTLPIQEGSQSLEVQNYDIEFNHVVFGYEDYSVINDVSFLAKQGEVTALIGPSGSGKTTLAKLAARFWDIQQGKILLGGVDIHQVDPEVLLKNFSIVFQDVILFNTSIKENIKIGKKGATDEEIWQAAKVARCTEFIEELPEGIDTVIGENGQKLSGGERQRISIARAILKDAPIILLDEATASLDVENESLIQAALSDLVKEKTVLIIAHRLRTIRNADKIILLQEGKVVASGTDKELMASSEDYRQMLEASLS